ncbi:hypothetical protein NIES2100_21140 [Calothrix sp. NIES-2100]|uniref:hypothetical protein n=1 Tax=Calothrix sp. NIES-2100 TaxID=1954172 RepID=UPI000B5FFA65|nr:hypothetical protein NIES2100_21140 [Calothrix sp. NIES-2100]
MSDKNLETHQPDPAWDYYLAWHSLQYVKSKIEQCLTLMSKQNFGSASADEEMIALLESARNKTGEIITSELIFTDDDDELDEDDDTA